MLESWREGSNRPEWPAPGWIPPVMVGTTSMCAGTEYGTQLDGSMGNRPSLVRGPRCRLLHPDHFSPEGWFQGEYDLVYRWTGRPSVIDIKASQGKGDRSGGYIEQLRLYAWLWWETHDRAEEVESLEIWYLGPGKVKEAELPSLDELEEYSSELKDLYFAIHAKNPSLEDCPADRPLFGTSIREANSSIPHWIQIPMPDAGGVISGVFARMANTISNYPLIRE